ncbi:recombination mediator RecR [Bacteroidales bacterium OttesenSCG-928-B11]|nr:recombination mediator RecR [Bacteroidales bacterium OttesenSCG-928-C03]MDL2311968.1 recombination mediator RecR [Bacteroidales bacterium OttesenSCG-928-B11]
MIIHSSFFTIFAETFTMFTSYSKYLDQAINEIAKLPGIGKRTALRLALHINKLEDDDARILSESILNLKTKIVKCSVCHNISDDAICEICRQPKRNTQTICVVQDIRDLIAIENTAQYSGLYHVLGGVISPMDGIGPAQLSLSEFFKRIDSEEVEEVILALPATVEGDTTNFYIYKNIKDKVRKITTLARGVGIGEELEYADEVTLGRSLHTRTDFEMQYQKR